jgi:photosystem II stability/assembly factor-like uncharacterized protein
MAIRSFTVTSLCRNTVCILLFVACDTFREDVIESEKQVLFGQTSFYILPGSSIVIDLKSVIKSSFLPVSLKINTPPRNGILTELDSSLLKYTPYLHFDQGTDQYVFSVVLDDGSTLTKQTMNIFVKDKISDYPCGVYAVEDKVRKESDGSFSVNPVKNDQICGVEGLVKVSIHLKPKFGDAVVIGDSIVYRPWAAFRGNDEMVYRISNDGNTHVEYGIISLTEYKTETLAIDNSFTEIFFVNDTVGFIAGGQGIYKTTDGGRSWNLSAYSTETDYINFQELYFLDRNHGFVAFRDCNGFDDCDGGWMMTSDGGTSWKRTNIGRAVNSIYFTSSLTGFIVSEESTFWPSIEHDIHKTIDGGKTWNEVFTTTVSLGELKVRFVNDQIGYAYWVDKIFATTDGGESWNESARSNYVTSFALTSGNVICAGFASDIIPDGNISLTTPTYIVRSHDGVTWTRVRDFPYVIIAQGFSPQGDLGVLIGISGPNPSAIDPASQILTISTSTDRGQTWVDYKEDLQGFPLAISVPSRNVAYILCQGKIIKYTP